jgi:hypothetical protein
VFVSVSSGISPQAIADLDPATGKYLASLKAVEAVEEPSPPVESGEPKSETAPAAAPSNSSEPQGELDKKSTPAKAGKEKSR